MKDYIELDVISDNRGDLIFLESNRIIPFEIKRIYYIYNTNTEPRGFHAHKNLKQVMFCIQGSCKIVLDDGFIKKEVILDKPEKGYYIDSCYWREIHQPSKDCILMVLADNYYDESDYIRDYETFVKYVKEKGLNETGRF